MKLSIFLQNSKTIIGKDDTARYIITRDKRKRNIQAEK